MYRALREDASFGERLPHALKVMIVPARAAVWATTEYRRDNLDALVAATEEYRQRVESLESERRSVFGAQGTTVAQEAFLRHAKASRHEMHTDLLEVLGQQPEVVADRATDVFVTQYDVIREGGLYVAEQNKTMTMRELAQLQALLNKVAKSKSGRALLKSSSAAAQMVQ
jgi:hypothetical protein